MNGFLYGREELSVAYHNKKFTDSLDNQQRSDNLIDKRRAVCRKQNKHDTECDSENTKDKRNRFIFRGHVAVLSRCYGDHAWNTVGNQQSAENNLNDVYKNTLPKKHTYRK